MKEEENNADEKEISSEVEKAELPLKVKKSLFLLKAMSKKREWIAVD